jgi:hypothetical protein
MTDLLAPSTANGWLQQALIERLRGHDEAASRSEQSAHSCPDYTSGMCVGGYLLPAAKRHAQFTDDKRWAEVLASAREHAEGNLHAQLMILVSTGSALIWRGKVAEGYILLLVANALLSTLARALPQFFGLWMDTTRELGFALRCLAEQPDEAAKAFALLG